MTRTDTTQPASVDDATQDGTASARTDYSAVFGTLRFAAGEATKTVVVAITDDRFQEASETFSVVLSNPSGVSLGTPSSATVQVTSDDAKTGPNPVADGSFDAAFFVRQHYADFRTREFNRAFVLMQYFGYLRRAPNEAPDGNFDGYNFWLSKLNQFNGNFVAAEMVKAFITSDEYRLRFGP